MLMIDLIISAGVDRAGTVSTDLVPFDPALREMCEMNSCGMFGKTYTCPPHAGTPEALMKEAKAYKNVTLFQKVYPLEDSFDFEGMVEAKRQFHRLTADILKICRENLDDFLLLGAGGCPLCERCGVQDGIPCRFPLAVGGQDLAPDFAHRYIPHGPVVIHCLHKGHRHRTIYRTDWGDLEFGVVTKSIHRSLDDRGGELKVRYGLEVEHARVSDNDLHISIQSC